MKLLAAALILLPLQALADVITEFGAGGKMPRTTSYVLLPACHTIYSFLPEGRPADGFIRSCGGDNPLFVGWPVAWQSDFSDVWTLRAGWFHMSHWADGGKDRETHMDAIVITATFNWTKWKDGRP